MRKLYFREFVMFWTIMTTIFFWTSLSRAVFKPEISHWKIFQFKGYGMSGDFWLLVSAVGFALFLFYLEGRGKYRNLFYILITSWHLFVSAVFLYGAFQSGSTITFQTWGIKFALSWVLLPISLFFIVLVLFIMQEKKGFFSVPAVSWKKIYSKGILLFFLLFPLVFLFFRLGAGFDVWVKIAIVVTIVQWILLTESLRK